MKKLLSLMLVLAMVLGMTAVMASAESDKYGGTLVYCPGVQDEQNLGCPSANTNMLMDLNASPALESLFRQNDKGEIVCWLAESVDVSEDGLVYTIKVRPGISFHDGSPLNAESVAWNIQACKDAGKGQYSRVETVEVTGEYEVVVTMSLPDILFLSNLAADPVGLIISKEAYEKNGAEWCEKNPVGTGPFKFVSWENDVEVVYTRNDNYWGKDAEGNQLPYLDGVRVVYINDTTVSEASLQAGDVMAWIRADSDSMVKFQSIDGFVSDKSGIPICNYNLVACNCTDNPAAIPEVREAIACAVDFDEIVDGLFADSCVNTQQNSVPGRIYNDDELVTKVYDPERAKELLAQAGYPDGVEINFYASNVSMQELLLVAMVPYLEAVGITANVNLLDSGGFFGMLTGNFKDGFIVGGYNYSPDEFGKMYNLASNSAGLKTANTTMDEETYQLFEDARSATTQEEAAEIVKQIQKSIYQTNRYFISYLTQYECKIVAENVKDAGFYEYGGYHWTPEVAYLAK